MTYVNGCGCFTIVFGIGTYSVPQKLSLPVVYCLVITLLSFVGRVHDKVPSFSFLLTMTLRATVTVMEFNTNADLLNKNIILIHLLNIQLFYMINILDYG